MNNLMINLLPKSARAAIVAVLLTMTASCGKEAPSPEKIDEALPDNLVAFAKLSQATLQQLVLLVTTQRGPVPDGSGCFTTGSHYDGGILVAFEVDFGAGCTLNGITQKGSVLLQIERNEYNTFISNFYFTDYSIDDLTIDGEMYVADLTNLSVEFGSGFKTFSVYPNELKMKYKSIPFQLSGHFDVLRTIAGSLDDFMDDNYRIDPQIYYRAGSNTKWGYLTGNIDIKPVCEWPVSGKAYFLEGAEVDVEKYAIATVDFGNGNCDNEALYTANGESKTISF